MLKYDSAKRGAEMFPIFFAIFIKKSIMATQSPKTSPWTIIAPDTGIHKVDMSNCSNFKQEMGNGGTPVAVTVTVGNVLITVADIDDTDPFSGNPIPSYTAGDKQVFSVLPNQAIFFKAAVALDAFIVAA